MSHTVLGSITLGYQPLWNQLRQLCAVQLSVDVHETGAVDASHLVDALRQTWSEQAPALILSISSPTLLADVLDGARAPVSPADPWIEVSLHALKDADMLRRVRSAHQRGLRMVWRGEPGVRPPPALATCFHKSMLSLTTDETLTGLRISLKKHHGDDSAALARMKSPVQSGQIYEGIASQVLVEHCLDEQGAWSVLGWPMEDVLYSYRHQLVQPSHRAIVRLVEAADADESMEAIEHILSEEPLLAYRFLRYANSAGLGLRTSIESLRHGLMVLGYASLKHWLLEQLPHATSDLNLHPIRTEMVLRARLMEKLLDAGDGDDLRREVYLCGLLSQVDMLLGESVATSLQRLPLSERVISAILSHNGPYAAYLDMAAALESSDTAAIRKTCLAHGFEAEEVNRALLRTLAVAQPHPARGLLLV